MDGLSPVARGLVQAAEVVFGGARHLALARALVRGTPRPWTRPFTQAVAEVLACRGRDVCVLVSGDPFCHGVGSLLAPHVAREETLAVPAPSTFSLAAARLLWPLPETTLVSLCGRAIDFIRPHLQPAARVLALTGDERAPAQLARLLCESGFGDSRLTVMEALAGPRERIRTSRAEGFQLVDIDPLNIVALEVVAGPSARVLSRAAGLPDGLFEHDGQITKREVRALTISALAPRYGDHLWDIGAGAGSVAIEWLLADRSLQATALEQHAERAARVRRNAAMFGVPHLQIIEGTGPGALEGMNAPDAIFLGGGATRPGMIETLCARLRPAGRLVVNAITLETERLLLTWQAREGGTLTRIDIAHASPIGRGAARMHGWRPAMAVLQWVWVKPC